MTDFFRNIAPGVAKLGTGYLSAQRATQEKVRQEEMDRDKAALGMYKDLLTSGQWEPVDPKKGAREGGVLAIGGMFLQPRALSLVDQAKFEHEKSRWAKEREGWDRTTAEAQRAREHAEAQRVHEKEKWQHELEKLKLDRLKKDEEKAVTYTNTETGAEYSLTDSEVARIMRTPPPQLPPHERSFQQAYIQKKIERAKFGALAPKPRDELAEEKWKATRITDLMASMYDKDNNPIPEPEIKRSIDEINTELLPDGATSIYIPDVQKAGRIWGDAKAFREEKLPVVIDKRDGQPRQMTIGDIRDVMDEFGMSFEDAYNTLKQKIKEYMGTQPGGVIPVPPPPQTRPVVPPVMRPTVPPVS